MNPKVLSSFPLQATVMEVSFWDMDSIGLLRQEVNTIPVMSFLIIGDVTHRIIIEGRGAFLSASFAQHING